MEIQNKVRKFIQYCNCLSEFDKYFWLTKLSKLNEKELYDIYDILLSSERNLMAIELKSIENIHELVTQTYPELKKDYLPEYTKLLEDYKVVQNELTIEHIHELRGKLSKLLTNKE